MRGGGVAPKGAPWRQQAPMVRLAVPPARRSPPKRARHAARVVARKSLNQHTLPNCLPVVHVEDGETVRRDVRHCRSAPLRAAAARPS